MDRMLPRILTTLGLTLGLVGCGPPISVEADWVQWMSYRAVLDIAVSAGGDTVIGGVLPGDGVAWRPGEGSTTPRPFFARVAEDGTLLDSWTGFLGAVSQVGVDDREGAYLLVTGLHDDADWTSPEHCELRALDRDGGTRWAQRWDYEQTGCPHGLAIAGDVVAVRVGATLEAFSLDGEPRWQRPVPGSSLASVRVAAGDGAIWGVAVSEPDDVRHVVAWRYDTDGRQTSEIDVELGDRLLASFHPTEDGALLLVRSPLAPVVPEFPPPPRFTPDYQLMSVAADGRLRWERTVAESMPEQGSHWTRLPVAVTTGGANPWVWSTERRSPEGLGSVSERYRMILQQWTTDGELEATFVRTFTEGYHDTPDDAPPDVLARSECNSFHVEVPPQFGSLATELVVRPDGSMLLAGEQGCRDSFLMHLVVER